MKEKMRKAVQHCYQNFSDCETLSSLQWSILMPYNIVEFAAFKTNNETLWHHCINMGPQRSVPIRHHLFGGLGPKNVGN